MSDRQPIIDVESAPIVDNALDADADAGDAGDGDNPDLDALFDRTVMDCFARTTAALITARVISADPSPIEWKRVAKQCSRAVEALLQELYGE